jgi:SulP family sulfate permease
MSGSERHNPNAELFGQGVANIVSPMFGGLPATGAIARTATNIRSGGKTPVAGMIHALTLLIVLLVAAPLAKHVPLATLAAILFVVAWNMGEWRHVRGVFQQTYADIAVWAMTFMLTVFADLTVAVQFGMIAAALLFIGRIANTTTVSQVTHDYLKAGEKHILQDKDIPPYATILRIHGPFLFGATDKLTEWEDKIETFPPVVLLRLRNMTALDATGLHAIETFSVKVQQSGRALIVCGMPPQPRALMKRAKFREVVGELNLCRDVEAALERAEQVYKSLPKHYTFDEG